MKHSPISPSKAWIWVHCKAFYQSTIPSEAGARGTELHELAQKCLTQGVEAPEPIKGYVDYLNSKKGDKKYETPVSLYSLVPLPEYKNVGNGYIDAVIRDGETLEIVDLKTGKQKVEPENNLQLSIYAYCYIKIKRIKVQKVLLTIWQNGTYSWETTPEALEKLVQETIRPNALKLLLGSKEECKGDYCMYCERKSECKAYNPYENQEPEQLSPYDFLEYAESVSKKAEEIKSRFKTGEIKDDRIAIQSRTKIQWKKDVEIPSEYMVLKPITPTNFIAENHPELVDISEVLAVIRREK